MTNILIIAEKPAASLKLAAAISKGKYKKEIKNQVSYYVLQRDNKTIFGKNFRFYS